MTQHSGILEAVKLPSVTLSIFLVYTKWNPRIHRSK